MRYMHPPQVQQRCARQKARLCLIVDEKGGRLIGYRKGGCSYGSKRTAVQLLPHIQLLLQRIQALLSRMQPLPAYSRFAHTAAPTAHTAAPTAHTTAPIAHAAPPTAHTAARIAPIIHRTRMITPKSSKLRPRHRGRSPTGHVTRHGTTERDTSRHTPSHHTTPYPTLTHRTASRHGTTLWGDRREIITIRKQNADGTHFWISLKMDHLSTCTLDPAPAPRCLPYPCRTDITLAGSRTVSSDLAALGKGPGFGTTNRPCCPEVCCGCFCC